MLCIYKRFYFHGLKVNNLQQSLSITRQTFIINNMALKYLNKHFFIVQGGQIRMQSAVFWKLFVVETLRWKKLWLKWPKEYREKYFQVSKMVARGRNRHPNFFKSFFTEIYLVTVTKNYMIFKAHLYPSNFCLTLCDVSIKIKWWGVIQCFFK